MFFSVWSQVLRGKSLVRALMNLEASTHTISGKVLDVGSGESPGYLSYLKKSADCKMAYIDNEKLREGSVRVDLEREAIPFADASMDGALMFNLLEHIYHYDFLLAQAQRVLKDGATLTGFVPFLIGYHPDPHDYFRYTNESLAKMFSRAGFRSAEITPIGPGPFSVGCNTLLGMTKMVALPTAILWPIVHLLDTLLSYLKPGMPARYPLGYFFVAKK